MAARCAGYLTPVHRAKLRFMMFKTLIDVDSLQELLGNPQLAVIDCRFDLVNPDAGRKAYLEAHIPARVTPTSIGTCRRPWPRTPAAIRCRRPTAFAARWLARDRQAHPSRRLRRGQRIVCRAAVVDAALVGARRRGGARRRLQGMDRCRRRTAIGRTRARDSRRRGHGHADAATRKPLPCTPTPTPS